MNTVMVYTDILECCIQYKGVNCTEFVRYRPMPKLRSDAELQGASFRFIEYSGDGQVHRCDWTNFSMHDIEVQHLVQYKCDVYCNDMCIDSMVFICSSTELAKVIAMYEEAYKGYSGRIKVRCISSTSVKKLLEQVVNCHKA